MMAPSKPHPVPQAAAERDAGTAPLLRIEDLAVSFGAAEGPRVQALDGVRLSVHPRQTLAVVGESGCGKSVTAMSVLKLLPTPAARYERGSIVFADPSAAAASAGPVDLLKLSEKQMRSIRGGRIAMIFQEPMTSLNPVYTIGDQIVEAILLHQNPRPREAAELAAQAMAEVGIADPRRRLKAYPHQFSGGMRQRVMIAMALACRPVLLLADEPTTALDVTIQAQILDLLRDLRRRSGLGIMLITHDLGVVAENADVVCVMYAGRVVEYAGVLDLFDRPLHPYTRGLLRCIPTLHDRRARLVTIKEVIDNPTEFTKLPGAGLRPWWPGHQPPKGLKPRAGPAGEYVLHEIEANHWVGLWRTEAVAASDPRPPDSAFRAAEDPARHNKS